MQKKTMFGKVAIVTGGASGIGREICLYLAGRGAKVIIADINYELAKEVESLIIQNGGDGKATKTDVSNSVEIEAMISEIYEQYSKIDLLINNAGIGINGEFQDMKLDDWKRIFDIISGVYFSELIMCTP